MTQASNPKPATRSLPLLVALLMAVLPLAAWPLSADREQEIGVNAEGNSTISSVDGKRVVTFRQNVVITQGSMELRGDEAVLEYDEEGRELQRVSVSGSIGKPASFQQLPEDGTAVVTGSSETIYYLPREQNRIEFIGTASFNQNGAVMNCVEIRHSIDTGVTEMTGPCTGILPPQSL